MKKLLLGAVLVAATLVPAAASARSASQVELALVPLPKSALGAAGRALPLARDSGVTSNAKEASNASGNVTAKTLKRLGRVSGYMLDYGNTLGDSAGIRQIQTEIEQYRTAGDARNGLAFWRRQELGNTSLKKLGIDFVVTKLGLPGIPGSHWVYGATVSIKGLEPIHGVDAEIQDGQYLLDVTVSAGSSAAAAQLVPKVARAFRGRLQLALAGHLHGKRVALPQPLKPGPPAHGPKPAALVLKKADLGSATVVHKGYVSPTNGFDPNALSVYDLTMGAGGLVRPCVTGDRCRRQCARGPVLRCHRDDRRPRRPGEDEGDSGRSQQRGRQRTRCDVRGGGRRPQGIRSPRHPVARHVSRLLRRCKHFGVRRIGRAEPCPDGREAPRRGIPLTRFCSAQRSPRPFSFRPRPPAVRTA